MGSKVTGHRPLLRGNVSIAVEDRVVFLIDVIIAIFIIVTKVQI